MENTGVKWGVIGGIASVAFTLILYLTGPANLFGWFQYLGLLIYIFAMVKAAQEERNALGGYMTWGEALKPTFLTYVIMSAIYIIFSYVLNNFIDPGLEELQRQAAMEMMENMSGILGEEGMEAAMEEMEKQDFGFSIGKALMGWGIGLIIPGFIFAAIISAIIKKNPPEMA